MAETFTYTQTRQHAIANKTFKLKEIAREVNGHEVNADLKEDRSHSKHQDVPPEVQMEIAIEYAKWSKEGGMRLGRSQLSGFLNAISRWT